LPGLLGANQPLFYYGPPPAIKAIYKNSIYDSAFHPMNLIEQMSAGHTRSEIVASWGITYSAFNNWLESYADLAEAYAVGKPAFDAYHKQALRHSAFGQSKNVRENSLFFLLKNVAGFDENSGGHEYRDGAVAEVEFVDE